jgi:hypothetical protein
MKERLAAVSVGGTKNVPCVRTTAQGTEELGHSLPLPAEWVPNPLSTFCLVVDENRAGLPVHPGDIIVLDTSCNDAKDLCPFWGRHVLIKADPRLIFPSDTKPEGKVGIDLRLGVLQCKEEAAGVEGRLISDDGLSWVACLSLISDSDAEDQSGNKGFVVGRLVEHPTETLRESLEQARAMESFEQFHASYPTEQVLAFQEKVRNEAPAKIRLNRYFEIVGIVLGWFRPGAKKAKE